MNKKIPEIEWLRKNSDVISIRAVEKQLTMGQNTLCSYLKGQRNLATRWEEPLIKWVQNFIKLNTNNIKKTKND